MTKPFVRKAVTSKNYLTIHPFVRASRARHANFTYRLSRDSLRAHVEPTTSAWYTLRFAAEVAVLLLCTSITAPLLQCSPATMECLSPLPPPGFKIYRSNFLTFHSTRALHAWYLVQPALWHLIGLSYTFKYR